MGIVNSRFLQRLSKKTGTTSACVYQIKSLTILRQKNAQTLTMPNKSKIAGYVFGLCLLLGGGSIIYFYTYEHDQLYDWAAYILIFFGWLFISAVATNGTIIDTPQISSKEDKVGFFKQKILTYLYYSVTIGAVFMLGVWLTELGAKRKHNILQNEATGTTIAVIDHIDPYLKRNTVSYYALFKYTANGKLVTHSWHVHSDHEFSAGQRFEIKYSVKHPDMFMILKQLK